ncbi:MAG: sulfite exporter TauE/SafE family protein [Actinomycetota bacterium]
MDALAYLLSGLASGLFSGGLGQGGAAVATPLLRLLGLSPHVALGTPVPMILPGAVTGALTYLRAGMVDRAAVVRVAPAFAATTYFGALLTRRVDGSLLMLACAAILLFLAIRLLPSQSPPAPDGASTRHAAALPLLGAGVGLLAGLLGVGGGFLMVPAFIHWFRMPTKTALGTSLAVIALTVAINAAGQNQAGNIDWVVALLLTVGVVPGARLGALLAIRAPERRLRIVMAVALSGLAVVYAFSELTKLGA